MINPKSSKTPLISHVNPVNRSFMMIALLIFIFSNANAQLGIDKAEKEYFTNPLFAGDYPDPSLLRDGENYYIVHSSK